MSRYDIDLFEPPPDPDLVCCICKSVLDTPVESPCRHVFCRVCIMTWHDTCPTCPTCRRSFVTTEPVMPMIQGIINRLKMKCANHASGCTSMVMLEQFEAHVKDCEFKEVTCQFKKCGKVMLRGALEKHEDACTFREIKCRRSCGLMIAYVDRKKHDCVKALQKCISEQRELLQRYLEKESDWERMRALLEKQVTKLSESIASSRRNSLTPWGMSLMSWLNLDSDHASAADEGDDYEDRSRNGSDDNEYVFSNNVNDDGGRNADGGDDSDDTVTFPLRSRAERQSVSETRDVSAAVLSRDRSRSPGWSPWQTPGSASERRRYSRSRHSRPLSRRLSRSRPDLTSILEPDAAHGDSSDDRTRTRDSDRSSAASEYTPGSNWSFDQELPREESTYDSNQSSSYYVDDEMSDGYDEGDYDNDTPEEYASPRDSASPNTEEDTRTVVSVSDSAEFSVQDESDGDSRSLADTEISVPVTVDSGTTFDDANEETTGNGSAYDYDVDGWSSTTSDRSENYREDDGDKSDHTEQDLQTYSPSVTYTTESPVHGDYADPLSPPTDVYHDPDQHMSEGYSDPTPEHLTDSADDKRDTPEDGRPDFTNVILDIDITVSAEETVGEESHALPETRNRTPSSPVEETAATRKRRRRGDDGDAERTDSRRKRRRRDQEGDMDGTDGTRVSSRHGDEVESFGTTRRKSRRSDDGIDSSRARIRRGDDGGVNGMIPERRKSQRGDRGDEEAMNSTRTVQNHSDEVGVDGEHASRTSRRHRDVEDINSTKNSTRYDDVYIGNMAPRSTQLRRPQTETRSSQGARTMTDTRSHDNVTANTGSRIFNPPRGDPATWILRLTDPLKHADDIQTLPRSPRLRKHTARRHSSSSVARLSTSEARRRNASHSVTTQECAKGDAPRKASSRTSRQTSRTSTVAAGREDVTDSSDNATVTGSGHRRHTIQGVDGSPVARPRHRPSRHHKDNPVTCSPVDGQEAECYDDLSWISDSDPSSDESLSTELALDSTYEVRVPKSWVQMLNEYDSQDSDDSWQP